MSNYTESHWNPLFSVCSLYLKPVQSKNYDMMAKSCAAIDESSPELALKSFLADQPISSTESLVRSLKNALVMMHARSLGAKHILLPTSATDLAIDVLSGISTGEGFNMPSRLLNQIDCIEPGSDGSEPCIQFLPCKDSLTKELVLYNHFEKLRILQVYDMHTNALPRASIFMATQTLVTGLEKGFPSTVATVVKTASKLIYDTSKQAKTEDGRGLLCVICNLPCQDGADGWMSAVSIHSMDTIANDGASSVLEPSHKLCYACNVALNGRIPESRPCWTEKDADDLPPSIQQFMLPLDE